MRSQDDPSAPRPVALLTGATSGIGLACARRLCESGHHAVISSRSAKNVADAVSSLRSQGLTNCSGISCHAGKSESRKVLLDHAASYGPISALVLCAATSPIMGDAIEADSGVVDKMFALNVRAVLDMVKESVPYMNKDKSVVVVVGSIAAYSQLPKLGIYSVTKTAVHALVRVLAEELAKRGTRVVGVAPGLIRTGFSRPLWENPKQEDAICRRQIPLNRLGEPSDIAGVVNFLVSDEAQYITGECIVVAGGMRSRL